MPGIYRSMKKDGDRPLLGQTANTLGVRPGKDITPQPDGTVQPNQGGMSVAPSLGTLYDFLIPQRLRNVIVEAEGATGKDNLHVWRMGIGSFEDVPLAEKLALRTESPKHGLVEPDAVMLFAEYQAALQNTQDDWVIDEEGTSV